MVAFQADTVASTSSSPKLNGGSVLGSSPSPSLSSGQLPLAFGELSQEKLSWPSATDRATTWQLGKEPNARGSPKSKGKAREVPHSITLPVNDEKPLRSRTIESASNGLPNGRIVSKTTTTSPSISSSLGGSGRRQTKKPLVITNSDGTTSFLPGFAKAPHHFDAPHLTFASSLRPHPKARIPPIPSKKPTSGTTPTTPTSQSIPPPPPPLLSARGGDPDPSPSMSSSTSSVGLISPASSSHLPSTRNSTPPSTPGTMTPSYHHPRSPPSCSSEQLIDKATTPTATTMAVPVSTRTKPKSWADLLKSPTTTTATTGSGTSQSNIASNNNSKASASPRNSTTALSKSTRQEALLSGALDKATTTVGVDTEDDDGAAVDGITSPTTTSVPNPFGEKEKKTLAELLEQIEFTKQAMIVHPRGLINNGNLCFANSVLQVLLYCPPFYTLLKTISKETTFDFSGQTPTLDAMIMFLEEFKPITKGEIASSARSRSKTHKNKTNGVTTTTTMDSNASNLGDDLIHFPPPSPEWVEPFVPEIVYESMKTNKRFESMRRGTQEDAQEFLGFFLETLHDEVLTALDRNEQRIKTMKALEQAKAQGGISNDVNSVLDSLAANGNNGVSTEEDDGWMEVGAKGKTVMTRTTESKSSPVTKIFEGQLRSILHCPGQKGSVTLEPYMPLQLDIQPDHVRTISDALLNLTVPETISGITNVKGQKVDGNKQVFIETLPPVLVLHLKRFLYDEKAGGAMKSSKIIGYDTVLEIKPEMLAPIQRRREIVKYQLFAVIYHHGRYASGGHYTASVRQPAPPQQWINIDDTDIRPIPASHIAVDVDEANKRLRQNLLSLDGIPEKNAYLLFYQRIN